MITQENIPCTADEIKAMVKTCEKYNKALEKAKKLYGKYCINNVLEDLFPELKESNDERIRKAIHIYLYWLDGRKDYAPKGIYSIKDMIAWLEKHKED